MLGLRDSFALRPIVEIHARDVTDTLRSCAFAKVRDAGNVLRTAWSALTALASPSAVYGYGDSAALITVATNAATATPTGGVAPYTYLWSAVSGSGTWTILNPTSATTSFQASSVGGGEIYTKTFKCAVTDANGSTAETADVTATVENVYSGPPGA